MNPTGPLSLRGALRRIVGLAAVVCCSFVGRLATAAPAFVYESSNEFMASGDFNGDGIPDVLVLDKLTGNARVGYADTNGNLKWSQPLVTGVNDVEGCGVGRWLYATRDTVAVTAQPQNSVNLVDLSGTNTAAAPVIVTPNGIGPHTVVPLADPSGGAVPTYNDLLVASSDNTDSAELLDLMGINAGSATGAGQYKESDPFDRGNALQLSTTAATFATGVVRGTNDALDIWQFTNAPAVLLTYSNLPSGSAYAFGLFNTETLPRFLFYLPGESNVVVVPLQETSGVYLFGPAVPVSLSQSIQGVFYVSGGASGGSFMIQFNNGVQNLSFPGGVTTLSTIYSSGVGAAGNAFTGIVPLAGGNFALLDAPSGAASSAHAQVVHFNGTNFTQLTSGNMSTVTSRSTRANVWLFQTEPFVNRTPGFIASFSTPDWSDSIVGLPGPFTVTTEDDGGASAGLGSAPSDEFGAPPGGSFGLPNQYNSAISLFSYNSPQTTQPVTVTISPPPGIYDGAITISFTTLIPSDRVYYRAGAAEAWHAYTGTFLLTNDNTIQYYGTNSSASTRSQLQTAAYSLGIPNKAPSVVNLLTGTVTNNPPIYLLPTNLTLSPVGTVFYGRRSTLGVGSIWAINYDGSDDAYITTGVRPRVSRDGHWMAFMRGPSAFQSHGSVWIRNISTGKETELFNNSAGNVICYDWMADSSGIVMDYDCGFYLLRTNGVLTLLYNTDCYEEAPVINPVNGDIAFQEVNPGTVAEGLYLATPGFSNVQQIIPSTIGISWPEWSPDGTKLSFTDNNSYGALDNGTNLWVVNPDGSDLDRICDFDGTTNRFQHGALWSPDSASLVGAATLDGTNGLWIVPLNQERSDCMGGPILLPTTPGDSIDFAGSIVLANPPSVPLNIGVQVTTTNSIIFYWGTNFPWKLEYTLDLNPPIIWTPVIAPFPTDGLNFLYREAITNSIKMKFFHLVPP